MDYLLVASLALAVLFTIDLLASMFVAGLWHCLSNRASEWPAAVRTRLLVALRIFPLSTAFVVVLALFLPSYLLYEPRPADEVFSMKLETLASLSLIGIAMAVWRGLASLCATRRLVAAWMRRAEVLTVEGSSLACFSVPHPFPVIAVVGIFRPRLFLSQRVLQSLDRQELLAALEHELGHLHAQDNLKRVAMGCCRDLLSFMPCGGSLERAWKRAAESAADEYAARRGGQVALDLASALVKVARMVPEGARPAMPVGVSLVGEEVGEISTRVRRLAQIAESGTVFRQNKFALNALSWSWFYLLFAAAIYLAVTPQSLQKLHAVIDSFFPFLN